MEYALATFENDGSPTYKWVDSFHGTLLGAKIETGSTAQPFNYAYGSVGSMCRYYRLWLAGTKKTQIPVAHVKILRRLIPEGVDVDVAVANAPGHGASHQAYAEHDSWLKGAAPLPECTTASKKDLPPKPAPKDVDYFTIVPLDSRIQPLVSEYHRKDWVSKLEQSVGSFGRFRIQNGKALFCEDTTEGYRPVNTAAREFFDVEFPVNGNVACVGVKPASKPPANLVAPVRGNSKTAKAGKASRKGKEPASMELVD